MDDSFVAHTRNQLGLVKDLLGNSWDPSTPPSVRGRITLVLERIAVVQELMSSVSEELSEQQTENEATRRALKSHDDLRLQKRESQQDHQKTVPTAPQTVKYFPPDQGLIDSYSELAIQNGALRRETDLMRGNVEVAIRLLGEWWVGDQ